MSRPAINPNAANIKFLDAEMLRIAQMYDVTDDPVIQVAYEKVHYWLLVSRNRLKHGIVGEDL